jgi:hypothetical protein
MGGPFEGYVVALQHGCERWTPRQPPSVTSPTAGRYISEQKLLALIEKWRRAAEAWPDTKKESDGPCPDCREKCANELEAFIRKQP